LAPLDCREFYNRVAGDYDQDYAYTHRHSLRQAAWLAKLFPASPLLDLGCGTGRMLTPLRRAGFAPVGLDCSPAMLELARRQGDHPLVLADARQGLPFRRESFAIIISLHATLIHLAGPGELDRLTAEARRVLRPGGVLVVELPHPATFPAEPAPGAWREYQPGMSCRAAGPGLEEMRLDDKEGLTTMVRTIRVPDVQRLLRGWSQVELHPGFGGGKFRQDKGEVMVVVGRKRAS
jgi:SAM-dependent methyltransferase